VERRITSRGLLAMLFLEQPSRLVAAFAVLVAHTLPFLYQDPHGLCCMASQLVGPSSVNSCIRLFLPRSRILYFPWQSSCDSCGPALQPVKGSLNGGTTLWGTNQSWLGIICKLAEGTLCPILQVINEDVTQ